MEQSMYVIPSLPDTQALTEFRERSAAVLKELSKSDRPLLLTQKGKAAGVVMSPKAYERLADAAHLSQSIAAARQSLQEFHQGKGRPAKLALDALEAKYRAKLAPKA